jgi:hypothetical protein
MRPLKHAEGVKHTLLKKDPCYAGMMGLLHNAMWWLKNDLNLWANLYVYYLNIVYCGIVFNIITIRLKNLTIIFINKKLSQINLYNSVWHAQDKQQQL